MEFNPDNNPEKAREQPQLPPLTGDETNFSAPERAMGTPHIGRPIGWLAGRQVQPADDESGKPAEQTEPTVPSHDMPAEATPPRESGGGLEPPEPPQPPRETGGLAEGEPQPERVTFVGKLEEAQSDEEVERVSFIMSGALGSFWLSNPDLETYSQRHGERGEAVRGEIVHLDVPAAEGQEVMMTVNENGEIAVTVNEVIRELPPTGRGFPGNDTRETPADMADGFIIQTEGYHYALSTDPQDSSVAVWRYATGSDEEALPVEAGEAEALYVAQLLQRAEPWQPNTTHLMNMHNVGNTTELPQATQDYWEQSATKAVAPFTEAVQNYIQKANEQTDGAHRELAQSTHQVVTETLPEGSMRLDIEAEQAGWRPASLVCRTEVVDQPPADIQTTDNPLQPMRRTVTQRYWISPADEQTGKPEQLMSTVQHEVVNRDFSGGEYHSDPHTIPVIMDHFGLLKQFLAAPRLPKRDT
jgi:hypothetical protein